MVNFDTGRRSDGGVESLERYFADIQSRCADGESAARSLLKVLSRLQKAAIDGDALAISKLTGELSEASRNWQIAADKIGSFKPEAIESLFRADSYFREVADLATAKGISGVRSTEGRLFSFPYVVEKKKNAPALAIGSRTLKQIRPSAVVTALADARKRGSQFSNQALLDAVETIYETRRRGQATDLVPINEVYDLLTVMPESGKNYPFFDFLANLDAIKRSGIRSSKTKRTLDLPTPSTTGKGGRAFRVIREDGREQHYHMLRFVSSATHGAP